MRYSSNIDQQHNKYYLKWGLLLSQIWRNIKVLHPVNYSPDKTTARIQVGLRKEGDLINGLKVSFSAANNLRQRRIGPRDLFAGLRATNQGFNGGLMPLPCGRSHRQSLREQSIGDFTREVGRRRLVPLYEPQDQTGSPRIALATCYKYFDSRKFIKLYIYKLVK